jgi:hypothetical protein
MNNDNASYETGRTLGRLARWLAIVAVLAAVGWVFYVGGAGFMGACREAGAIPACRP